MLSQSAPAVVQGRFRRSAGAALSLVAIMWVIHFADAVLPVQLVRYGVEPRDVDGLVGLVFAPLLHGSVGHLFSNSLPLLVLMTGLLYLYPRSSRIVLPATWIGTGLVVWLLARDSLHIGASGLVYGLAAYIFVAGVVRRDARAIAASLLVWFLYGSMVWGVLPIERGVSWETHLGAALIASARGDHLADRIRRPVPEFQHVPFDMPGLWNQARHGATGGRELSAVFVEKHRLGHGEPTVQPKQTCHRKDPSQQFRDRAKRLRSHPTGACTNWRGASMVQAGVPAGIVSRGGRFFRYPCSALSPSASGASFSASTHLMKTWYPADRKAAPMNIPRMPPDIMPPRAPISTTGIGTSRPRPRTRGFRMLSVRLEMMSRTEKRILCNVELSPAQSKTRRDKRDEGYRDLHDSQNQARSR